VLRAVLQAERRNAEEEKDKICQRAVLLAHWEKEAAAVI
jgi:hypothetical protein